MKAIFGAIYRRLNDSRNEQHYYLYIPVAYVKDGTTRYKMVDTYEIPNPCWADESYEKKLWYLEQANCGETSAKIFYGPNDYYYQNYYELNSLELDDSVWKLVADLHDYRMIRDDEAREYLPEDLVMYLPLWLGDSYRWGTGGKVGRCFVKNNAQKDGWKIYIKSLADNDFHFTPDWRLKNLKETCKNVLANMKLGYGKKKEIKNTLKKLNKFSRLSKEYDNFCKNLKR